MSRRTVPSHRYVPPARFDVTFTYHYTGPDFDPPDGTPTFHGTLVSNEVTLNAK